MNTETASVPSYREYLRKLLLERQKKNPRFSLRQFAKLAGVQPSFLSMVLSGQREISEETAHNISEKLQLTARESKRFQLLVRYGKSSSPRQKQEAIQELRKVDPKLESCRDLAVDQFRVISEWYHLPLRLLAQTPGFDWSEANAAQALGISTQTVREALERMAALELIDWKLGQKPVVAPGRLQVISAFKNDALQKYHRQMLEKVIDALGTQDSETRYTRTQNLALSKAQLKAVRAELEAAEERIAEIANRPDGKKSVYHLNLNLIHLLKPLKEKS